ncbi:hypothetical protein OSB04_030132 [Centaurea solstitialis]|uniref:Reverse transcriptase domain-containing protein n=1 Tax=Centaurea solstitialis TaxID=347529 RepID=A0AA38S870_9ASTR|nr:hypothetical protein OSB04_030132 [Centaurea solstitialis]
MPHRRSKALEAFAYGYSNPSKLKFDPGEQHDEYFIHRPVKEGKTIELFREQISIYDALFAILKLSVVYDKIFAVKHFERVSMLQYGGNDSFIALVSKSKDPLGLNDYRHIHLMGCFSKVVSKVLAGRLKLVIDSVISPEQTTFVKGKNITDGLLIAFDNLGWSFLFDVMKQMEFGSKWIGWIEGLISTARVSVLVNGTPTDHFPLQKGVRQGDHLSPFLFIIAVEGLIAAVKDATGKGFLNGVSLPNNGPSVSSLHYADDSTLMGIKVQSTEIARVSLEVGCKVGLLPFTYLGFPIGTSVSKESSWKTLYDKCHSRLSGWKTKTFSFGGKITLCKSVLGSLGVFLFSLYKAPNRMLKKLESLRMKFFWGRTVDCRKIPWVAWDKIINDRKKGGLGVGSLKTLNVALISKWRWRFRTDPRSLWKDVIVSLHGKCGSLGINGNDGGNLGVWRKIASINKVTKKINTPLEGLFCKTLGNGAMTEFWKEQWCSSESLENIFPRLAALEENRAVGSVTDYRLRNLALHLTGLGGDR